MTRMARSGSPSVDRSVAWSRDRGGDMGGFGGRRAPVGVGVDATRLPKSTYPHIATTELTGNVRVAVGGVASGIRTTRTPPA
jgi:hypothetical protein